MRPAFAEKFTVYAVDRRGRGESGAPAEHELERQFEDIVAVIAAAGESVDLIGHSYGAHCALGAAAMAPHLVRHLVLYEPPTLTGARGDVALLFEEKIAAGDASAAVEAFFLNFVGWTAEQVEAAKPTPFWPYLMSFAPTMPSEGRALIGHDFSPARFASLEMPALFLVGSETKEQLGEVMRQLETVMPRTEWFEFVGHGHGAMVTAPKLFADTVLEFLSRR